MDAQQLLGRISLGEDSITQFKRNINNDIQLSEELVAFSNSEGGDLIIGVDDNLNIIGLNEEDIRRLNLMISNVASQHIKPAIAPLTYAVDIGGKKLLVVSVKKGIYKPYCTKDGKYIIKSGSDKRKITQEELQRLFQESNKLYADESIIHGTTYNDININKFKQYYKKAYDEEFDEKDDEDYKILENLSLCEDGKLTLAGLLLFSKRPQLKRPAFMIKAISFLGNESDVIEYRDSEDIYGTLDELYKNGMSFLTRNLRKIQKDRGFNTEGEIEVPKVVLEELLVNALIHRDYFIDSPIKLFIFDNRIEIISPGKLPNTLNVDKIKSGISIMRNPILTSIGSKLLPYRGVGTGIRRAIKFYNKIDFYNEIEGELFKTIIYREI